MLVAAASLIYSPLAGAQAPLGHGVLVHLQVDQVVSFDARHNVQAARLNPNRDLYLVTAADGRTDQQLLQEVETDPAAVRPELNQPISLTTSTLDGQSTASVLNGQSSASVLNGGTGSTTTNVSTGGGLLGGLLDPLLQPVANLLNPLLGTVLNVNINVSGSGSLIDTSTGSIVNSAPTTFYGAVVPSQYPDQTMVGQIHAGRSAHSIATGRNAVVALIDNGVDPLNPVLMPALLAARGYNFYDNSPDWSAYADLADGPGTSGSDLNGQSTASVLNGQSTASVLNGQSTASVLNGGTCAAAFTDTATGSEMNGQSTASVLNGQSTASVLNGQSTASVLNGAQTSAEAVAVLNQILACDPDFGHGTSVAGLIHLVAPEARILPIKAFGPGGTADAATIYASITYAIDQHANVMNLSFSAADTTPDIRDAIQEAVRDGIVVVAAAGNSNTASAVYPASFPGVVGAGAVDGSQSQLPKAGFSNFDPGVGAIVDVDVAAPGVQLFTTYPGGGQIWATAEGTSFSTPLIAGESALLVQLSRTGSGNRSAIENSSNPAIGGDANGALGHGMINVQAALQSVSPWHLLFW